MAAQRDNERRTSADNQLAVGELAVPISAVRRADITRVEAARGEVPVLLPTPVGGDAPTTEPEPTPISTPYPHNSLYLTLIAQQLALRGAPSNSPGSIHVTADCSDAGKVVGQGEFGSGVLLTGIAAGAELYWRDAAVASNSCVGLNLRAVREHVVVPESNSGGLKVVNTASVSLEIDLARDTSITLFRGSTCEIGSEISTITAAGRTSVPLPYGKTTTISYMVSYFNDVTGGCQLVNNRFLQASFTYLTGAAAAPFGENYGTRGDTEQIGNMPPARSSPAWFIKDGKFYIHGGNSATGWGDLNDLWVYDIARQRWTWLSGVTTLNNAGSFGTLGVTAPTNQPPAKAAHKMWLLNDDAVYLFGAYGLSSQNSKGSMADMWLYDLTSSHWAWVHGPSERNSAAVYGPVGERGASYRPGGSYLSATFVDIDNTIYLYGGNGPRGDLWRWYPAHKQWSYEGGTMAVNAAITYGTKGVPSDTNSPGSYSGGAYWFDPTKRQFWIFGGERLGANTRRDDLWMYDLATKQWTWMAGSDQLNRPGIYSGSDPSPGARRTPASWRDSSGKLWLLGGEGYDEAGVYGLLSDLWYFDTEARRWVLVHASTQANRLRSIDSSAVGAASPNHLIQGMKDGIAIPDYQTGMVYLFGGDGSITANTSSKNNQLFAFPL